MASFDKFYKSLPEDSNKRGDVFERIFVPWFLKTDPEWSTKVKQIWLWDEYPDRWGKDCGIDLVYEDHQGRHWAVQCKCISPDREISKAEIDSFLSESNDPRIYGRLLIASTDGIGKNARQVIKRQEKQVVLILKEHLSKSELIFPESIDDLSSGRRKDRRTPRPHQKEAIQKVVAGLQKAERGQLLMACGTGKTLTSLWIKESLNAKRTLVLLPSLSLLSQTLREWTAASQKEFNWICVCSDKSVAKEDKSVDKWIESTNELGVPVTSDPTEIRSFLLDNKEGVIFSTYQSSPLVAEAQKISGVPEFDIAFADEAHRCAGKVSPAFGCVLDAQKIRAKKCLFMTATPRVLSNRIKSKAETEDIEIASMDDEELFGNVFHRLNFSEAIKRGLLTDYRVIVVGVDDPDIHAKINNRPLTLTNTGVENDFETLANHISLFKSIQGYDLQRVITFHSRVKAAKKFSEDHPGIADWLNDSSTGKKPLKTAYVSGEMTSLERNKKINKLRNLEDKEVGILSNARCLSEGVDVPTLDGIAFIDPRSSQVDIIQSVGRAIRRSESKSYGYIIIPVYLGDTDNIDQDITDSRFKDVWDIILALKSQDDSLTEVLDCMRIELGRRGSISSRNDGLSKIIFDLPQRVETHIGDSLKTILVRNTTDNWDEMYGKLIAYEEEEGHARPPKDHSELGNWVSKQRIDYNKNRLSKRKVVLLNQIESWTWDAQESGWSDKYEELVEYCETYGHAQISNEKHFRKLKNWCIVQRSNYKQGALREDRKKLLEDLRPKGWMWDPDKDVILEKIKYVEKWCIENNSILPKKKTMVKGSPLTYSLRNKSSEFDLLVFITTMFFRYKYRFYKNDPEYKNEFSTSTIRGARDITDEEIEALKKIPNWYWHKWEGFARVYKECHKRGTPVVNQTVVDFDVIELRRVGDWVSKMRMRALSDDPNIRLKTHQVMMIESLPGWTYEPHHDKFMYGFKRFLEYTKDKSDKWVPKETVLEDGFALGTWVNDKKHGIKRKKQLGKNALYSRFYKKLLDDAGFIWENINPRTQKVY